MGEKSTQSQDEVSWIFLEMRRCNEILQSEVEGLRKVNEEIMSNCETKRGGQDER